MKIRLHYTKPKSHPFPVVSWAIRLFTGWNASHVCMEFYEWHTCFHIYFNDWLLQDMEMFKEKHEIVHTQEIDVPEFIFDSLWYEAQTDRGTKTKGYYGYLIGSLFGKILHIPNPAIHIPWWNATTCSESLYTRLFWRLKQVQPYSAVMEQLPFWKISNISPKGLFKQFEAIATKVK